MKKAVHRSLAYSVLSPAVFAARVRSLFQQWRQGVTSLGARGAMALLDQIIASATNFLTGVIIGRACTKEEFGLYLLCFNIVLFVIDLQSSLLASPYTVFSQRLKGIHLANYTGSTMMQQLLLSTLTILCLWIGNDLISLLFPIQGLHAVINTLIVVVVFIMFKEFIRKLCFANLFMKAALVMDAAVSLLQLGGLLFLYSRGMVSARTALWVMGVACAAAAAGWLLANKKFYSLSVTHLWSDLTKNWSFGSWIFGSGLLWALSMTLYPWILAYFYGSAAAGIWAACWGVISIANPLVLGVQNFLGPRIVRHYAQGDVKALLYRVKQDSLLFILFIIPVVIILFWFGGDMAVIFYGTKYAGNGKIISVLSFNLLIMCVCYPFSYGLLAMEKVRAFFMANIAPLLITLSCGIYLVKNFGPLGVALGLFLGVSITALVITFYFFRSVRPPANG